MKNKKGSSAVTAGLGYTVGNMFVKGLAFLSLPIFTRLMSTDEMGLYSTFLSYVSIMTIIVGLASHTSIKNAYYDYKNDFYKYCSSMVLLVIINASALTLLVFVLGKPLSAITSFSVLIIILMLVESFANSMLSFYNSIIALQYKYKEYVSISVFYSVTSIILSIILIKLMPKDEAHLGRILGSVIPMVFVAMFILIRIFKKGSPAYNKEYWKYGTKISIPLIPHGLSQIILAQFDRIMIKHFCGNSKTGLYSFAFNLALILQVISASLDAAWIPWVFDKLEKKEYDKIKKVSSLYLMLFSFLACGLLLISPEVIMLMGEKTYWVSKWVSIPLILVAYFTFVYTIPSSIEYYFKKTKLISLATLIAAGMDILLNLIFIPMYGYIAAGYTTLFCYMINVILHMIFAKKVSGRQHFYVSHFILCIGGVLFIGMISLVFMNHTIIRLIVCALFLAVSLFVALKNKKQILEIVKK